MIKITTERLILRDIKASDAKANFKHFNNKKIIRNFSEFSYPLDYEKIKRWTKMTQEDSKNKIRKNYHFAICLKEDSNLIGSISIKDADHFHHTCELAYWLSEDFQGKGIMHEAAKKVIEFCFIKLKMQRININAFVMNNASNGLIKKLGFVYEGTRKQYKKSRVDNKYYDLEEYGLLKKEWQKKKR